MGHKGVPTRAGVVTVVKMLGLRNGSFWLFWAEFMDSQEEMGADGPCQGSPCSTQTPVLKAGWLRNPGG
jgi:hypothetical protein